MRESLKLSGVVFLLACTAVLPAWAQSNCGPLKVAAGLVVKPDGGGRPTIPVSIAGKSKFLLVDTGGFASVLNRATARELNLSTQKANVAIISVNGQRSDEFVRIPVFGLGHLQAPNFRMLIQPGGDGQASDTASVGVLGPDVLQAYDADFDFAGNKFNLIEQDHCKGQVVYWPTTTLATVPFHLDKGNHVTFPLTVDGKKMTATLDTGASNTTMNLSVAKRVFDLDVNSPDVEQVGQLQGNSYSAAVYRHRFKNIAIEGIDVVNPMITLLPDLVTPLGPRSPQIGSLINDPEDTPNLPDLILGMSVLAKLHVYIAYKERMIYITPAEAAAPPPAPQ